MVQTMADRRWAAIVRRGRPMLLQDAAYRRWFAESFGDGATIEVVVRRPKSQRSTDQLRYWFGVPMRLLSEATGYTKLQCHYLCLSLCFGFVVDPVTGREVPTVPLSRGLSTKQFAELIEWVPAWALEVHKLSIPLPNEVDLQSLPGDEGAEI